MTVVSVRAVSSQGAGVAELPDGRVVFVHRTAPGDRARVRVTHDGASWARADLVEVLEPSGDRREAPCPLYDDCGGCRLQHLGYRHQLRWKGRMVADALERIGGLEGVEPPDVEPSPDEFGYRSRVTFHLRRKRGGPVIAGLHRLDRAGEVLDVDDRCLLPEASIREAWRALRAAWGPGAGRLPAGRALRLTLRGVVDGVTLVVEPEDPTEEAGGAVDPGDPEGLLADVDGLRAVWLVTPGAEPRLLAGDGEAEVHWWDRRIRPGARAFLQVNREAARGLHEAVLRELGSPGGRRIVDAYCGAGSHGRRLAHHGGEVVGIESDAEAVAAARFEAPDRFRVLQGRVETRLPEALPADLVLVNPPRSGLHEDVPRMLRDAEVPRIVYVSCDPATLARDVGRLGGGYRLRALKAFDLFPQTAHLETLAVLDSTPGGGGSAEAGRDEPTEGS